MTKLTKRHAFNFLRSYFDVLNEIPKKEDKLDFLLSIINKQFLDEDPEGLNFVVKLSYESQRHAVEKSVKGWKRANNTDMLGNPPSDPKVNPPSDPKEEEEKEEEEEKVEYTKRETIKKFLDWFNSKKLEHTKKKGRSKSLTDTDYNNLMKLKKDYNLEDFDYAIVNLFNNEWAIENNSLTPTHFLRNDNFNRYYNQEQKNAYLHIDNSPVN